LERQIEEGGMNDRGAICWQQNASRDEPWQNAGVDGESADATDRV
jgi:hypothetical protein